jgi:hypothetical protein
MCLGNLSRLDAVELVAEAIRQGISDGGTINWHYDPPMADSQGLKYSDEGVEYNEHSDYGDNAPLFYCYRS